MIQPTIDSWYQNNDQKFKVIAIDDDDDTTEIQYFDGSIEELEMDVWHSMEVESINAPEDWSGPFDDLEKDDLNVNVDIIHQQHEGDWQNEIDKMR